MSTCEEFILDDVVRIDIYDKADVTSVSIPFNVPYVLSTEAATGDGVTFVLASDKKPVLSLNLSWVAGADAVMEPSPKIQTTEKREPAGLMRYHSIEATVTEGFEAVQKAADTLAYADSYAVLTTWEGTSYLCNAFPNTSVLDLKDNRQQNHTQTVKYTAQSYSGFIRIKDFNEQSASS